MKAHEERRKLFVKVQFRVAEQRPPMMIGFLNGNASEVSDIANGSLEGTLSSSLAFMAKTSSCGFNASESRRQTTSWFPRLRFVASSSELRSNAISLSLTGAPTVRDASEVDGLSDSV